MDNADSSQSIPRTPAKEIDAKIIGEPNDSPETAKEDNISETQINPTRAFAILVNDGSNGTNLHAVYTSFRHAVRALKAVRLQLYEGFIVPADSDEKDNFPFRNKAGGICNSVGVFLGWGYKFRAAPRRFVTKSVWIKRTSLWHDSVEADLKEDVVLSEDEVKILEVDSEIGYVVMSKPLMGKYDRKLKDFVFD